MPLTAQSPQTVADYCAAMDRKEIRTNSDYQRSDKVWPPAARSFLIESILLGYPIPKIFLFQKTDLRSKKTIKEVVDGQQRSKTIHDFFSNRLVISKKSSIRNAAGKTYTQLDDELKGKFLNYQLSVDLFLSATPREIREAFRRLNSYTVPLNPEEKRHAEYQGEFKWFVQDFTGTYEEAFLQMGVYGEKQLVRMQDTKLVSEIIHALLHGIQTTKTKQLDDLYKANDREFARREEIEGRLTEAFDWIGSLDDLHEGPLMVPHVFYSLSLAAIHIADPSEALQSAYALDGAVKIDRDIALSNLSSLAEALEVDPPPGQFEDFVHSCVAGTNVQRARAERFRWMVRALLPELL